MRRLILAAAAAILALAAILAWNTVRSASRQIAAAPLPPQAIDVDAAAQRLSAAIRCRTISYDDGRADNRAALAELRALLERDFPNVHRLLKKELINGASLLYTWQGSDPALAPVLLMAHQDVVPVSPGTEKDWLQDPFGGVIDGGFVWGRGSWDDKGNLMAMMEAVEALAAHGLRPARTLYLAFGHDEEIGGQRGARAIAETLRARAVRLEFVLDEGLLVTEGIVPGLQPPVALVGTAEKGYLTVNASTKAVPGHSSMPPRSSAIGRLSRALVRLEDAPAQEELRDPAREMFETLAPEYPLPERLIFANLWLFEPVVRQRLEEQPSGRAMLRTTTALTTVHAGDKENVLPGRAEAQINFRLLPGDSAEHVLNRSRDAIADPQVQLETSPLGWEPSPVSPTDSGAYRLLARTIRESFPGSLVAPGLMIGATDSRRYEDLAGAVFRFTPVRARAGDLARFHGTNERISLANYAEMIRFYRRLAETATQAARP